LFELHEDSIAVFWVDEDHGLAVSADFDVAQQTDALCLEVGNSSFNVVDFEAQMMDSTRRILVDECLDRRLITELIQQFQLGVSDVDEDGVDSVIGLGMLLRGSQIELGGEETGSRFGALTGECDVVYTENLPGGRG